MNYRNNIFYFLLIIVACQQNAETSQEVSLTENTITVDEQLIKEAGINFTSVQTVNLSEQLKLNGVVDVPPQNMVSVSMPLGGYLSYTKLLPGMHFKKGEAIATMEDVQYVQLQEDYLKAKTQLTWQEMEFKRQETLYKQQAISDKQWQQTQADYQTQKINLSALREKLALLGIQTEKLTPESITRKVFIKAPIDGFVTKVNVNTGKYVNPSDVLFELVNPDDIHLNLTVYENDIGKLRVGQRLKAFTVFDPNIKHDCEVLLIGKDISENKSASVHCHFLKYDAKLIPGMFMSAVVEINNNKLPVLPAEAVVMKENKHYIFVQVNNQFVMREVQTGIQTAEYYSLTDTSGLMGKKIVNQGAYTLLMKLTNTEE